MRYLCKADMISDWLHTLDVGVRVSVGSNLPEYKQMKNNTHC